MNRPSHRSSGFTLIELLVVIAIIGILIALLMPAVQYAREAARRSQCSSNLHQMGLALHNYADAHKMLPPGYVSDWNVQRQRDTGPGWGWAAMILPYLEEGALYETINFERNIEHPENETCRLRTIGVYFCPSDNMPRRWAATRLLTSSLTWIPGYDQSVEFYICDVAGSNYAGVFGIGEPGVDGDGLFFRNSDIPFSKISDGLANTMAVGERSIRLNNMRGAATWTGSVTPAFLVACGGTDPDAPGGGCHVEDASGMTLGHTGEGNGPGARNGDPNQFLSEHGYGCHFLFADGHVRYLDGNINYLIYKAMSTRANGETFHDQ